MLRSMNFEDINIVVELHKKYIPGALFPELGDKFMKILYKGMLESERACLYVWEDEGNVEGFIAATSSSSSLMKEIFAKKFLVVVECVLIYLLLHPVSGWYRLWETFTYSKRSHLEGVEGELLFIALTKKARKKGVSDLLVLNALQWLKSCGLKEAKVTTYVTNRGANALLQRMGFTLVRDIPFRGNRINLYKGEIDGIVKGLENLQEKK